MPRNTIGLPVTARTESAAPPRASPSALVRMMPVSSSAALKARAELSASCPAIASTTNRRWCGAGGAIDGLHFLHELSIDVQSAGRVDDQRLVDAAARRPPAPRAAIARRIVPCRAGKEIRADALCQPFELQDGRGPAHVGTHQQHATPLSLLEPARQLGRGGGLARALQARQQHNLGRLHVQRKPAAALPEQPHQLAVQDADQGLAGREAGG